MSSKAWLSLGANLGDPPAQLADAVRRIAAHPQITIIAQSSVLSTEPWGKTDQPDFANMAIGIDTTLKPMELLDVLLGIEVAMGRVREEVWGPRLIDIDIIAYDQFEIRTPRLTLPHPYAHERSFVLVPLGEIAPEVNDWVKATAAKPR
ncbi:2-amino-4-hydroxy-6-hydroxymethyldihydropteridine diphosphokinase [Devosia sp.]|uniref:2-amino-4-hydroxy-6- hydroxymethyldihydropteridine diphosphokinase n=1 Tax=Devosia sp. TaxID=1871048 RepID=UPI0019DE0F96|nr:2-amino-4-hydroxy-6-hydroxymethyldihydropteridine diphosphokinase [Devosia sp.]MBE0581118.1 2-amino-4-hydroxy-6-hydroxymethyldihydropteridine diphosphokinase [Devosia sp.]